MVTWQQTKHTIQTHITTNGRLRILRIRNQSTNTPFIEYKASSLTLLRETLLSVATAASAVAPPRNHFPCESRFVRARF
ncbi:hypothetical protein VNO77_22318 [Canavalia gladiata]|uniref:Uncharacterized protein n=1 Tax=Canavalia gladiata TaxID=3824 RepID=A0AAN9L3C4_CANGL